MSSCKGQVTGKVVEEQGLQRLCQQSQAAAAAAAAASEQHNPAASPWPRTPRLQSRTPGWAWRCGAGQAGGSRAPGLGGVRDGRVGARATINGTWVSDQAMGAGGFAAPRCRRAKCSWPCRPRRPPPAAPSRPRTHCASDQRPRRRDRRSKRCQPAADTRSSPPDRPSSAQLAAWTPRPSLARRLAAPAHGQRAPGAAGQRGRRLPRPAARHARLAAGRRRAALWGGAEGQGEAWGWLDSAWCAAGCCRRTHGNAAVQGGAAAAAAAAAAASSSTCAALLASTLLLPPHSCRSMC